MTTPTDDTTTPVVAPAADQLPADEPESTDEVTPEVTPTIEPDAEDVPAVEGAADDGVATAPEEEVEALGEFEETPAPAAPAEDAGASMFDTPTPVETPAEDAEVDAEADTEEADDASDEAEADAE